MELRPYQQEAREAIESEWEQGRRKTLLVLPTGCGKTIVFSMVAKDCVDQGKRVLILAHRGELLDQAADKMRSATGIQCSVEKAELTSLNEWNRVTVGSVQTLMRPKRLAKFDPDHFDTIIVDEAHHALSDSYQQVLEYFECADILGVTATPDRGDRRNLGEYFDSLAYEYTLPKAIKEGYLCPIKAQTIPIQLDLSNVAISAGDFKASDLGTALDPYLDQIAEEMVAAGCLGRKTVVFLPLIDTSKKFRDILINHGFMAAEVNGTSKDRAEILRDFENNRYNVLCNSMLLTEGWDCPSVDCIIVLRPTKVRSLYCQMVGRGTRLSPETGKDHLLLLDFLWHTERHELCRPAHLIASDEDVAKEMTKQIEETPGMPLDLEMVEECATQDVLDQREEALAKQLEALKHRKKKLVDPLQYEMSIQDVDLANYVPSFAHEMAPISDKQAKYLDEAGIDSTQVECSGKASLLIDRLNKRREAGLATPKQIRQLESRGFTHVGEWSKAEASKMITRIAANGWRTPIGIDPAGYIPGGEQW